jgi:hypothetical protein
MTAGIPVVGPLSVYRPFHRDFVEKAFLINTTQHKISGGNSCGPPFLGWPPQPDVNQKFPDGTISVPESLKERFRQITGLSA